MAFPTQWLVIGVAVTLEKQTFLCSNCWGKTWQGWNLHCHAWMTLVALVAYSEKKEEGQKLECVLAGCKYREG
ncbi:hypothetical protein VNO77_43946 [Canavalia gladiata]|uniref:Uncharacterized protein n=1 Tax=Canavalia gladiata TaxID=3824 RepID=A0AAN9PQA7_CANGL